MAEHGRPSQVKVEYRQTGADTAETVLVLSVFDGTTGKKTASTETGRLSTERYGQDHDVYLTIDHAHCVDWTEQGRKRLEEYQAFTKREARDIADYKRLRAKYGDSV